LPQTEPHLLKILNDSSTSPSKEIISLDPLSLDQDELSNSIMGHMMNIYSENEEYFEDETHFTTISLHPSSGRGLSDRSLERSLSDRSLGRGLSERSLGQSLSDRSLGQSLSDKSLLGRSISITSVQSASSSFERIRRKKKSRPQRTNLLSGTSIDIKSIKSVSRVSDTTIKSTRSFRKGPSFETVESIDWCREIHFGYEKETIEEKNKKDLYVYLFNSDFSVDLDVYVFTFKFRRRGGVIHRRYNQ